MTNHPAENICQEIVADYQPVFVARQPIFTAEESIWGYELLFRHSRDAATAVIDDDDAATASIIADGVVTVTPGLSEDKKLLLNFSARMLLDGAAFALPKERCVIELLETIEPTPPIISACEELRAAGYLLALDDYTGEKRLEPLLPLMNYVKVDVLKMRRLDVLRATRILAPHEVTLIAEKIETREMFELTRSLGYTYFQGYLFQRPEVMNGRKVPTGSATRLSLLSEISSFNYDLKKLAKIVQTDISLSYRLLRHLNSAYYSLPCQVRSIPHAANLLGHRSLRMWLMMVCISDLSPTPRAQELAFSSILRARFLERLAMSQAVPPQPPESMFLLGLFSRLDALLDMSMADMLTGMPLSAPIRGALLGEPSPLSPWLHLLDALERGAWEAGARILARLRLEEGQAARIFQAAADWSHGILSSRMPVQAS